MLLTIGTVRFPSGNIRDDVTIVRKGRDRIDLTYRCRYCGYKVADESQMFCNDDCAVRFDRAAKTYGAVEYGITNERQFSA